MYVRLQEKDDAAFSGALGFAALNSRPPKLPPGMEVAGSVTRLGWLRCNGEKRWIKVGHEFLEIWLSNIDEQAIVKYEWTKWAVLSMDVDFGRNEPALKATLGSVSNARQVELVLQAYDKDSEPTQAHRVNHLTGFLEELKLHLVRNAPVRESNLNGPLASPPKSPGAESMKSSKRTSPSPLRQGKTPPAGSRCVGMPPQSQEQTLKPKPLRGMAAAQGIPMSHDAPDAAPTSGRAHWSALGMTGDINQTLSPDHRLAQQERLAQQRQRL